MQPATWLPVRAPGLQLHLRHAGALHVPCAHLWWLQQRRPGLEGGANQLRPHFCPRHTRPHPRSHPARRQLWCSLAPLWWCRRAASWPSRGACPWTWRQEHAGLGKAAGLPLQPPGARPPPPRPALPALPWLTPARQRLWRHVAGSQLRRARPWPWQQQRHVGLWGAPELLLWPPRPPSRPRPRPPRAKRSALLPRLAPGPHRRCRPAGASRPRGARL
mmetsp:Transcript_113061/g.365142  ORF Transcript_113061/g.365142 Transcript_113061/m.365142 type:complete len:218 (-) Transcript_113061:186-839(-)